LGGEIVMEKLIPCNNVSINIYCKSDDVDMSFSKKLREFLEKRFEGITYAISPYEEDGVKYSKLHIETKENPGMVYGTNYKIEAHPNPTDEEFSDFILCDVLSILFLNLNDAAYEDVVYKFKELNTELSWRSIKAENYTFTRTESLASRFNKFIDFLNVLTEKINSSKVWTCEEYADITSRLILKRFSSDEIKSIKEDVASYDKFKENIVKEVVFKLCPDDDLPDSYKNGIAKGIDIAFGRS
jgi:hypothetical protein